MKSVKFKTYLKAVTAKAIELQRDVELLTEFRTEFVYFKDTKEALNKLQLLTNLKKLSKHIKTLTDRIEKQ